MKKNPFFEEIEKVRDLRRTLSKRHGHNPRKLTRYLQQMEKKLQKSGKIKLLKNAPASRS